MLERLPIRTRLAAISAALTFVILSGFAIVVGELTTRRIRSDFNNQLGAAVDRLSQQITIAVTPNYHVEVTPGLKDYAAPENAAIRIVAIDGTVLAKTPRAPSFGFPVSGSVQAAGYRVASRQLPLKAGGYLWLQYGRRISDIEATERRVRVFLVFGVLAGAALALGGGLVLARRAMKPVADLTQISREIARTRDPNRSVPISPSEDEVSELAQTLDEMLRSLEGARSESAAALARQREFVADASHELRTPLTSVYANLELLADVLDGEERDAAQSALRSTHRMKRLVADLLLLARADARRESPRVPLDLGRVVMDVAAELGPLAGDHEFDLDPAPDGTAQVLGARDELHRLALNLVQNAVEHTPAGTRITVAAARDGDHVTLRVSDDGPGIDDDVRGRLFERFVRGGGESANSTGLGLAIVKAVAEGHGGRVEVGAGDGDAGTSFLVTLPALDTTEHDEEPTAEQVANGAGHAWLRR